MLPHSKPWRPILPLLALVLAMTSACRLLVGTTAVAVGTVGLVGYGVYSVGESAVSAVGSAMSSDKSEATSLAYAGGDFSITRKATVDELWTASVRTLKLNGFQVEGGERDALSGYVKARTRSGEPVAIVLDATGKGQTRFRMRIGLEGDLGKSEILFDLINGELKKAG